MSQHIHNLDYTDLYNRIKEYYTDFMHKWQRMSAGQQSQYVFESGGVALVPAVSTSAEYISNLSTIPTINDAIDLAKNVIYQCLEYGFHDRDRYGIAMNEYARHIINTYNHGRIV